MTAGGTVPTTDATAVLPEPRTGRHRILWLIKGLGLGGAEQLVRTCVPLFDDDRFDVEVAYVLPHKDALASTLRGRGITVRSLGDGRPGRWVSRLEELLRTGGYDLVHTHSPSVAVAARVLAKRSRVTLVHTEHNVWERFHPATRVANALTFRRNSFIFGVSSSVVRSVEQSRWSGRRSRPSVELLHHGIDVRETVTGPRARAVARARLRLGLDDLVIGSVANFTPKKDHVSMLEGFSQLLHSGTTGHLVLVGAGPEQARIGARARDLGIADRVLFTGTRDDVRELLPAFDVFILTSRHEGLPIALLEAMAAGIPSVVTPVGGTREMITHGENGLFVPCRRPDDVARALARLLADDGLRSRMGAASIEAAGRFSIERAVDRMEEVYVELLGDPGGTADG